MSGVVSEVWMDAGVVVFVTKYSCWYMQEWNFRDGVFQKHRIGNKGSIGIRGFTPWKQIIQQYKMLPKWVLNLGPGTIQV